MRSERNRERLDGDPGAILVAWLTSRDDALGEKHAVYAALLGRIRAGGADARLAQAIAWLGLWPGLDAARNRLTPYFRGRSRELLADLGFHFCELLARLDVRSAPRVAASLVRGTARNVLRDLYRESRAARSMEPLDEPHVTDACAEPVARPDLPALDLRKILPPGEDDLDAARCLLRARLGDDGALVYRVVLLGEDQRTAGAALGLSHDAARRRMQRALARLRTSL